ncbi:MAG: hypothetical protein LBM60_09690 [Clostridium sp.]|nr:hypothetical protein [Clostridium sp.]
MSFKRFCGLELMEASPGANAFWLLQKKLKDTKLYEALLEMLSTAGLQYSKSEIMDSTLLRISIKNSSGHQSPPPSFSTSFLESLYSQSIRKPLLL